MSQPTVTPMRSRAQCLADLPVVATGRGKLENVQILACQTGQPRFALIRWCHARFRMGPVRFHECRNFPQEHGPGWCIGKQAVIVAVERHERRAWD